MVLRLECALESPGGLVKNIAGCPKLPQSFCFTRSGAGPRITISNKFPGDTAAAGPRTTLWEPPNWEKDQKERASR